MSPAMKRAGISLAFWGKMENEKWKKVMILLY